MTHRQYWERTADALLDGVVRFRSPSGALFDIPGPRPSDNGRRVDSFEGFARTFLLAAFRIPHSAPDRQGELLDRYLPGLVSGPSGEWPRIAGLTQPLVEAAAIATALLQVSSQFWPALDAAAQARLIDYFLDARDAGLPSGNWMWFQVMIETFLGSVGVEADLAAVDQRLDTLLTLRRDDGMWSDGGGARYDYYSSWALNFYPALWARVDGPRRPELAEEFRQQALAYRPTLRHLIDADGGIVLQGRSLIYRAAAVAGLWAPELFPDPAGPGPSAGASSAGAHSAGASSADIVGPATRVLRRTIDSPALADGVLTLGWEAEYLPLVQPYSGPASPYWMSKAFAGLLLAPEHPAWRSVPAGDELQAGSFPVPAAGWLLQRDASGLVRLHNHGTWRASSERDPHSRRFLDDPLYSRLAYSSATSPTIDGMLIDAEKAPALPDNSVVLDDGRSPPATLRTEIVPLLVTEAVAASTWVPASREHRWPAITSVTITDGSAELRLHRLELPEATTVTLTGYALSGVGPVAGGISANSATVLQGDRVSRMTALEAGDPLVVPAPAGAFGPESAMPALRLRLAAGQHLVGSLIELSRPGVPATPVPELTQHGDGVVVTWASGACRRVELRPLAATPSRRS